MNINQLPDLTRDWSGTLAEGTIYKVENGSFILLNQLPFKSSVTVLLADSIARADVELFLKLADKYHLQTCYAGIFNESGVDGVIFIHDRFDNEYSQELKFLDWKIDAFHAGSLPDTSKTGVILMDMDATCVQCECIDEMAKLAGIGEQVSAVTAMAMKGHMEFQESFRRRVALFNGKSESIMDTVEENLPVMPGFAELVKKAKSYGWKLAIASGGFTRYVTKLKNEFGLDYVIANDIEAVDGVFTGKVLGQIVDSKVKANTLLKLKEQYGVRTSETIAIGDGANDLPMISLAGIGIAIHAKPVVREEAPITINHLNLHAAAAILEASTLLSKIKTE